MSEEIEFVIREDVPEVLVLIEPDGRIRIGLEELVRRVKATECLSVLHARYACQKLLDIEDDNMIIQGLSDYARALEGDVD